MSEEIILSGDLTYEDIPQNVRQPFSIKPKDVDEIAQRLQSGGRLTLDGAKLRLGKIDLQKNEHFFFGVEKLILKNSRLVTNGHFLEVFCQNIVMDDQSVIESFEESDEQAPTDTDGDHGGEVNIYTINKLQKDLNFELIGQNGGVGSPGSKGSTGSEGSRGRGGRNGSFGTCMRGPGGGGRGGQGGQGGKGKNGGEGGDGGVVRLFYIETDVPNGYSLKLDASAGVGGSGGSGGPGGDGGIGGRPGANAGNCTRRTRRGPQGPQGPQGPSGHRGNDGNDGKYVILRIDVEDIGSPNIFAN